MKRRLSAAAILVVGLAVLRRLRRTRRSKIPSEVTNVLVPAGPQTPTVDVHRVFWERSRANRLALDFLFQGILWLNLFAYTRGSFTGIRTIIPFAVAIVGLTYVLISVTRFGSIMDIVADIITSLSVLVATFSTLYWNYGLLSNFTEQLTRLDAIYFTIGTLTTAGTGTISAVSQTARTLQGLQMVLDLGLIVFAVALAIAEISSRMQRQRD